MIVQFLTGVIVGILIGLALAPIVQSWIVWQQARSYEDRDRQRELTDAPRQAAGARKR